MVQSIGQRHNIMIIIVELWYSALANPSSSWSFKAAVYFFLPGGRWRGREREVEG